MRFLAISGSLRAHSKNTAVLEEIIALAPMQIDLYTGLATLPHFNPDLEREGTGSAVENWQQQLRTADAILICSPEYAHGVPGSLKNALDWVVGSGELIEKPVGLINIGASSIALDSLAETLRVMMADVQTFNIPIQAPLETRKQLLLGIIQALTEATT